VLNEGAVQLLVEPDNAKLFNVSLEAFPGTCACTENQEALRSSVIKTRLFFSIRLEDKNFIIGNKFNYWNNFSSPCENSQYVSKEYSKNLVKLSNFFVFRTILKKWTIIFNLKKID
jgi:hypothetical protein